MPFALGIAGIVLIITGVRGTVTGTNPSLTTLLESEFTGSGNYIYWLIAILVLGSIGYVKKLQGISTAFMSLVCVVLFIGIWKKNNSVFSQAISGLTNSSPASVSLASTIAATNADTSAALQSGLLATQSPTLTETIQPNSSLSTGNNELQTEMATLTEQIS